MRRLVKRTLEEEWTVETDPLGGEGFLDGCAVGGGVDGVIFGLDGLSGWHIFVRETMILRRGMGGEREVWEGVKLI